MTLIDRRERRIDLSVNQPDRDPLTITPSVPHRDCTKTAGNLLDCLGLPHGESKVCA
jgi:hypothetical protein